MNLSNASRWIYVKSGKALLAHILGLSILSKLGPARVAPNAKACFPSDKSVRVKRKREAICRQ